MNVGELIEPLETLGFQFWYEGNRLRFRGPRGGLSPEQRRELAAHRDATIAWLRERDLQRVERAPLSYGQRSLWLVAQENLDSAAYHVALVIAVRSPFDRTALSWSLQALMDRHAVLRTTYTLAEDRPMQCIAGSATVTLEWIEMPGSDDLQLRRAVETAYRRPFDLEQGPVWRTSVFSRSAEDHVLLLNAHHIAVDGWSLLLMLDELRQLYLEQTQGVTPSLPRAELSYADYVRWQAKMLAGAEGLRLEKYWLDKLQAPRAQVELQGDRPRPPHKSGRGATYPIELSASLSARLRQFAVAEGMTLFVVMLASFKALLHRYCGLEDIVVGSPMLGRGTGQFDRVVGDFMNPIPLRTQVTSSMPFRSLLREVRSTLLEGIEAQGYPLALIVERLRPERDPSRSPLFETMFVLQRFEQFAELHGLLNVGPDDALSDFGGLKVRPFALVQQEGQFDLGLGLVDAGARLTGAFKYNADLFDRETIERLLGHYERLLEDMLQRPDSPVGELRMLGDGELRTLLQEWNATSIDYPADQTVHGLFEQQVDRRPAAEALVFEAESLSYGELNARANRLAHHLRSLGVGRETLVGVWLDRSSDMVVAMLGALKAGAAYLPLDPAFPGDRIEFMMTDAAVAVVVTHRRLAATLGSGAPRTVCMDDDAAVLAAACADNPAALSSSSDLAYVIYTSGSTGRPKGVMLEHRSVVNFLCSMHREPGIRADDRFVSVTTLSFDIAGLEIHGPLSAGGTVVLASRAVALDGQALAALLEHSRATLLQATPTTWRLLLDGGWRGRQGMKMLCGGEGLPRDLAERLCATGGELWNMYGPTETTIWSTISRVQDTAGPIPIGRPIANTQAYVVEPSGQLAPVGVVGELCIGGDGLARGYLGRDELTLEKFATLGLPDRAGVRVYRTGDVVRWLPDGQLEFIGRRDHQVKLRGFRIELGEIEAALAALPGIKESAVLVREDKPGDRRLVAYVVPVPGVTLDIEDTRATLRARLPEYMIPNRFVWLPALPLTPNAKTDRNALPAPQHDGTSAGAEPTSALERELLRLWRQVLDDPALGIADDFFRHGGHSLTGIELLSRIERQWGHRISFPVLLQAPTVTGMAALMRPRLRDSSAADAPNSVGAQRVGLTRVSRDAPLPLSHMQQRLWLLRQIDPSNAAYNIPWAIRLGGDVDAVCVQNALDDLVARHESLRTRFDMIDGAPCCRIEPQARVQLEQACESTGDSAEREAQGLRRLGEFVALSFDFGKAPLARALLLSLGRYDVIVCLVLDHLVSDGQSMALIADEFMRLYRQHRTGGHAGLTPLPWQYADLVDVQRRALDAPALERLLAFWKTTLAGLPSGLALPFDRPRPPIQTFRGGRVSGVLAPSLLQRVRSAGRQWGATPFVVLVSAFQVLLHRYTGSEDIVVGTAVSNRGQPEADAVVGFFANNLVLRTDLSGKPTALQLLRRVQEMLAQCMAHQEMPFDLLVNALTQRREADRSPLFQILFVLQRMASARVDLCGAAGDLLLVQTGTSRYDISVDMVEADDSLSCHIEYNADLFDRETIERLLGHYERLLADMLERPDSPVGELRMLGDGELRTILQAWNATSIDYPADQTVHGLFEQQVQRNPTSTALVFGTQALSYGDLNARANRLAHHLRHLGVGRGAAVGIWLDRGVDMVVAVLGVLKAGAAYVPLDPAFPRERLDYMMQDAALRAVVTQDRLAATLPVGAPRAIRMDADATSLAACADDNPVTGAAPADLAYVIYTSGSTGRPKGVMVEHGSVVNFLTSMQRQPGIVAGDRFVSVTTLSFDIAGLEIHGSLTAGAVLILASRETSVDGVALAHLLQQSEATLLQATPSTWRLLLETGWNPPAGLKMLCGGEALPHDLADRLTRGSAELWNMYGPTETTIWSTIARVEAPARPSSIGRPIANTQAFVLDAADQPVPVGINAELCIGGSGLARGYLGKEDLTAEKFVTLELPLLGRQRVYRTGDVVRWLPSGDLEYVGRRDRQIKLRGYRIELGEIEAALAGQPGIKEAVVEMHQGTGPNDMTLVAYMVLSPKALPDTAKRQAALRARLPEYMVPQHFAVLAALPLTPNGKVDRKALPAVDAVRAQSLPPDEPRTTLEFQLLALWRRVLGNDALGIHDNFFDHGGHSLIAVELMSCIEQVYGHKLPLATLFQAPTVAQFGVALAASDWAGAWRSLVAINPGGSAMPMFLVPGVGGNVLMFGKLSKLLGPEQPLYGLQARGLDGKEEPFRSIPEMAQHYLAEIRMARPHGPYFIGGTCTGGVIAFDVAQRLTAQGEQVRLVLLETWPPATTRARQSWLRFLWPVQYLALKFVGYAKEMAHMPARSWPEFLRQKLRTGRTMLDVGLKETLEGSTYYIEKVVDATLRAVARYEPKPYPGGLLNVIAIKRPLPSPAFDTRRSWEDLAHGENEAVMIEAEDSGRLFVSPHVEVLASVLQRHSR